MRFFSTIFIILFTTLSCAVSTSKPTPISSEQLLYSTCFTLDYYDGYTMATVLNPWDSTKILHRYILVDKSAPLPSLLPEGTVLRTPLSRVVASSAVHCTLLDAIGQQKAIVAVCDPEYISHPFVKEGIQAGTISNVGSTRMVDLEKVVSLSCDAVIMAPFENSMYGTLEKTGIPIIECASYMENHPLGQTEWLKFHAAFYGQKSTADSLFNAICQRYNSAKEITKGATARPKILPEKRYGQVWYVPGGASYAANLYADAALDYPWSADSTTGSIPLAFENVYSLASNADVWMFRYIDITEDMTYSKLETEYPLYAKFAPFKNKTIYGCNTHSVPYYDKAIITPDLVLLDYIKIGHPTLLPNYTLSYYKPLEQ